MSDDVKNVQEVKEESTNSKRHNFEPDENTALISGEVSSPITLAFESYGRKFYEFMVDVVRDSGIVDTIPVQARESYIDLNLIREGSFVSIVGDVRTFNKHFEDGRTKLCLYVYVKELSLSDERVYINDVKFTGHICKLNNIRKTPKSGISISDVTVATNRGINGSLKGSYIPCIFWGNNARRVQDWGVSSKLLVKGRFQSRIYQKRVGDDEELVDMTAYEVSVSYAGLLVDDYENENEFDSYEGED